MEIPEYQDTELVAAEDLAAEPAFWLAHLLSTPGDLSANTEQLGAADQYGPESAGPGLSWTEPTAIAADVPPDASHSQGLTDPDQRLLLCLAQELMGTGRDDLMFEPSWTVTADSLIPVCTSEYSPRRIPLAHGITAEQSRALAIALGHPGAARIAAI